jgi:hypothetical protein
MGLPSFILPIMGKGVNYNPLTAAWKIATGETDTTILNALNTFEQGLITNSLTGKFNALYPFVGGTSGKHALNFMDTSTFVISFVGGWTHSATGSVGNGTNSHANTTLVPSTTLSLNDAHLSVYSRTNTNVGIDIASAITGVCVISITARSAGNAIGNINQLAASSVATANSQGWYTASRTGASVIDVYKNGSSILASTVASTSRPTVAIYLGARNLSGGTDNRTTRELAFASIGSGLTSGEISTLYTLVQAMQTSLSRQV